ncbi:golvesin C-terminal-like domain-containing protein [Micromonospora hortensis]|uniref:golvesin C-terminal-like domain-containing protein n=1 Tax=Micromonospora hortensis TaxID=2911209 RepID=UPI001EE945F7|nr:hypothetical protein [Micromonospora hortensis]MCG5448594.1 hypothetical protein [Micromonospora hortensis]
MGRTPLAARTTVARGAGWRRLLATLTASVVLLSTAALIHAAPTQADPKAPPPAPDSPAADPSEVAPGKRAALLGPRWRTSKDRAWVTSGDADGLHVLVADAREGYRWRTAATLSEPGFDTDRWIGNACVTGSGRRLVVAYAPRTFTNEAALFDRGAFTAVVDLTTGAVVKLPVLSSLAYFSPACGVDESAVLTQARTADQPGDSATRTRLIRVNAASGRTDTPLTLDGQVTSAVPMANGQIVAVDANRLIRIDGTGRRVAVAGTSGVPFRLVAGSDGGVSFLDREGDVASVRRVDATTVTRARAGQRRPAGPLHTVARGRLTEIDLAPGAGGRTFVTGAARRPDDAGPAGPVRLLPVPKGAELSTLGGAATITNSWTPEHGGDSSAARTVGLTLSFTSTGKQAAFTVDPGTDRTAAAGRDMHPSLVAGKPANARKSSTTTAAGSPSNPVEEERTCSVPRNDPRNQALQPKPRQVEWAANQAVKNALTVARPANWKSLGMPAYTPQGLFPPVPLDGGGAVPAQILLGIAAQESNTWQASSNTAPGVTGNPLIGNFYGRQVYDDDAGNDWDVDFAEADCGYGVMQVTDRMRRAGRERPGDGPALPYETQRAVALDFAANIAAGMTIVQEKWNETRRAGLIIHGGQAHFLENWFFALWAYNSGFHPQSTAAQNNGAWGVGWINNPANPIYPANRLPFMDSTAADASNPQRWPYQEKVLGFAARPNEVLEAPNVLVAQFRPAQWNGGPVAGPVNRRGVKPPVNLFCDATNNCEPGAQHEPTAPGLEEQPPGPCAHRNAAGQFDLKCWYNKAVSWKPNCLDTCGYEFIRFDEGYAYQEDGTSYPPRCTRDGLPTGALVIDDVPADVPAIRPNCPGTGPQAGTFTLNFAMDTAGLFPSKVDFHQLGSGFGGHFWMAHTRHRDMRDGKQKVSGTWALSQPIHGWTRVMVHLPQQGAWTRQADYVIDLGNGQTRHRVVNQAVQALTWVDLGVFPLAGDARVRLSTETVDGDGEDAVAFDAVAFVPTTKPLANYVAMGDSYSSGEGVAPYFTNSDYKRSNGDVNDCHRSRTGAFPTQVKLPGHTKTIAQQAAEGTASFGFIACSGAISPEVSLDAANDPPASSDVAGHTVWGDVGGTWGRKSQKSGEVIQVDQGWLDVDTTLVTLTIGGNDARFAEVMRSCIASQDSCYSPSHKLTRGNGKVDPEALRVYGKKIIRDWLGEHLEATYRAVAAKAPNAQILVLGYPQLFPDKPASSGCIGIEKTSLHFLNTLGDLLNIAIANTVEKVRQDGVNIRFLNSTQTWREGVAHWACSFMTIEWSNGVIATASPGSGQEVPGRGSFHPTAEGQQQLAAIVNKQLNGVSTAATVKQRILDYVATRTPKNGRWVVSDAQALHAAETCLRLSAHGGVVGDPCMDLPLIFPTTGNAAGAAENDLDALVANPPWVHLNFVSNTEMEKVQSRDWMDSAPYAQSACPDPRVPTGHQCDEYPFYSSALAAAWDFIEGETSPSSTKLKMIPAPENRAEGSALRWFYPTCGIPTGTYVGSANGGQPLTVGGGYLTIPIVTDPPSQAPFTFYVC